jgi:hypothetical protein
LKYAQLLPAECEGAIPENCRGQNNPWITFKDTIEFAEHPGCNIEVVYRMKGCTPWNYVQLDSMRIPDPTDWDSCTGIINNIIPNGIFGGINQPYVYNLWRRLSDSIAVRRFKEYYNSMPPQFQHLAHCTFGNATNPQYIMYFLEGNCRALCLRRVDYGIFGKWWVASYIKCKEACCLYSAEICYDPVTGKVVYDPTVNGATEITDYNDWRNCTDIQLTNTQCTVGIFNYRGPCEQYCPSEAQP